MLKKRVAATLIVKNNIVVQSIGFKRHLPVGSPSVAVEYLNSWGIDEIIYLDISASMNHRRPNFDLVRSISKFCRVPLTVGGGINSIDDIHSLMLSGADKVCFNQTALHNPSLISQAARIFGNQCIVASVDSKTVSNNHYVYDYVTNSCLTISPNELALRMQLLGAGEIFLNSVDNDGQKEGFDVPLINHTMIELSIPLIACGGAGKPNDFKEVLDSTKASALAAGNFFHYYEHSVTLTKQVLFSSGYNIRHETYFTYADNPIDSNGRLNKKDDYTLQGLLYIKPILEEI